MDLKHQSILSMLAPLFSDRAILMSETHARGLMSKAAAISASDSLERFNAGREALGTANPVLKKANGNIAIIPICGILTKQAQWYDNWVGLCAAETLCCQLSLAMNDASIEQIAYDIDTPGGFVNGPVEFADATAEANKTKKVTAVIRGMCCSGGYWIASQCDKILTRRESEIGNIGVYSVLMDVSKFYSELGIDLTVVASGQFKGLGADGKVTDDMISDQRRIINGLFKQFTDAVASGRGMTQEQVDEVSDGRAYLGSQSVQRGLADEIVSSFDEAIVSITGARAPGSITMAKATNTGAAPVVAADPKVAEQAEKDRLALEAKAASDALAAAKKEDDDDDDDGEDDDDDGDGKKKKSDKKKKDAKKKEADDEQARSSASQSAASDRTPVAGFISAFGDIGARWFYEGKTFSDCATAFTSKMKEDHKAELASRDKQIADLTTKLAAVDRGNEPASFSIDKKAAQTGTGTAVVDDALVNKVGSKGIAAYAAGLANDPIFKTAGNVHRPA